MPTGVWFPRARAVELRPEQDAAIGEDDVRVVALASALSHGTEMLVYRGEAPRDLALDLRWTWSHQADALWERIDAGVWERTRNPWTILSDVPARRFTDLATNADFLAHLDQCVADRHAYLTGPSWFAG